MPPGENKPIRGRLFGTSIQRKGECLIFTKYKKPTGYGLIGYRGKLWRAHRLAYFLTYGPPPPNKPLILHTCHNPSCVEPKHLIAGTQADNLRMMREAGRHAHAGGGPLGEANGASKLNPDKVHKIRLLLKAGTPKREIARRFEVCDTSILKIARGETWREVI